MPYGYSRRLRFQGLMPDRHILVREHRMTVRLIKYWHYLRASYWFVPALMVLCAIVLAIVTDWIDTHYGARFISDVPWLYRSHPTGARAVLSAIATSMIGVAGVTFSMTIVSVSFAAANVGPRLIGNFMRDTGNQVTLGTFIATFVYCLSVLRTVTDAVGPDDSAYVPQFSLYVALILTLASVSVLIYFIHHIPESINVGRIVALVGGELQQGVRQLFPENSSDAALSTPSPLDPPEADIFNDPQYVRCDKTGYLQGLDDDHLLALARDHNLVLRLEYRPGDFAVAGSTLTLVQSDMPIAETLNNDIAKCFVFGTQRTSIQNTLYLVDQLVEIMARALSPGVNDPFTAVSCMDWLQSGLTTIMQNAEPSHRRYDEHGNLRVIMLPVTFKRFAAAVFDQPLQYVAADLIAALHMMHMIAELLAIVDRPEYRSVLLQCAQRLNEAGDQSLPFAPARADLAMRYAQTKRIAVDPAYRQAMRDENGWIGGQG